MRPTRIGMVVLLGTIGTLWLSAPTSTQGRRGQRFDVQLVNGHEAVAREVLVKFRWPLRPEELAQIRTQTDAGPLETVGRAGFRRLRSRSFDAATLVALLLPHTEVDYVEPNYIVHAFTQPNDPRFPELWGLENIGQAVNGGLPGLAGSDIQAARAWDLTLGSTAHVVAVVDTGIDYTHPDLAANMWSAPSAFTVNIESRPITCPPGSHGFNAITLACNPMDDHNHGTHVAGTIGASGHNGIGVAGVNWTTKLMGLKFLDSNGSGTVADAISAIQFAIQAQEAFASTDGANVRVLSNSWGGGPFSQALLDEINAANSHDMLFVAAAGNSGFSNDILPTYPASYGAPNVVAVAATTNTDARASFSNYGASSVHLGAPGVDILSTTIGSAYAFSSGTSMATPHVSGAAALVLSRCTLGTAGLKDVLLGSVKQVPSLASKTITGGRLDVHNAIRACIAPPDTPTGLTAVGGDAQVMLTWSTATGATGYHVKRSLTSGGPYVPIASDIKVTSYTDATVVNGTMYFYVVAAVNAMGASGESNEASATPSAPPDLAVSSLTAPSVAAAGTTVVVTDTTKNQGSGASAASLTGFYLSTNTILDATDVFLGSRPVPALVSGATDSASTSLGIPETTTAGTYYMLAKADWDNAVAESVETNNTKLSSTIGIGPDLVVSSLTAPATAAAGGTILITDTTKNQGAGFSPASTTSFYLSKNIVLDAADVFLGSRPVSALVSGATNSASTSAIVPADTAAGTYVVLAKADAGNSVAESQEINNTKFSSAISIGPDLIVSTLTAPATAAAGGTILVADTTKNQGAGSSPASITGFYLSTNTLIDAADVFLGSRPVPALASGATDSVSTSATIPATIAAGTYFVLARADDGNSVAESQETNNIRSSLAVRIGPDLIVAALTAPSTATAGATVTVTDTTKNQGAGGTVVASTTKFFLSTNAALDAADVELGSRAIAALAAGLSDTGSTALTIPPAIAAGPYYIIAKADTDNTVPESTEGNNTGLRFIQISAGP